MVRPREFDMQQVLERAANVYWNKGWDATITADLERATGLKRGSLYNAFGDKRGLYLAALQYYCDAEMGAATGVVDAAPDIAQSVAVLFELT